MWGCRMKTIAQLDRWCGDRWMWYYIGAFSFYLYTALISVVALYAITLLYAVEYSQVHDPKYLILLAQCIPMALFCLELPRQGMSLYTSVLARKTFVVYGVPSDKYSQMFLAVNVTYSFLMATVVEFSFYSRAISKFECIVMAIVNIGSCILQPLFRLAFSTFFDMTPKEEVEQMEKAADEEKREQAGTSWTTNRWKWYELGDFLTVINLLMLIIVTLQLFWKFSLRWDSMDISEATAYVSDNFENLFLMLLLSYYVAERHLLKLSPDESDFSASFTYNAFGRGSSREARILLGIRLSLPLALMAIFVWFGYFSPFREYNAIKITIGIFYMVCLLLSNLMVAYCFSRYHDLSELEMMKTSEMMDGSIKKMGNQEAKNSRIAVEGITETEITAPFAVEPEVAVVVNEIKKDLEGIEEEASSAVGSEVETMKKSDGMSDATFMEMRNQEAKNSYTVEQGITETEATTSDIQPGVTAVVNDLNKDLEEIREAVSSALREMVDTKIEEHGIDEINKPSEEIKDAAPNIVVIKIDTIFGEHGNADGKKPEIASRSLGAHEA